MTTEFVSRACADHTFELTGKVVHGARRGRLLGFPTANVDFGASVELPADGVYAGRATTPGGPGGPPTSWMAAVSIGTNPTFGGAGRTVEAHLLDFDGDLYGTDLLVHGGRLLRTMDRFDSVDDLIEQMKVDVTNARAWLESQDAHACALHAG